MVFSPVVARSSFLSRGRIPLAACLLLVAPGFEAAAQTTDSADNGASVRRAVRSAPADGVGVDRTRNFRRGGTTFFRPLRTFRGRPVRVGPGNRSDLSIGAVRAIRSDGSDSVGVVRAIRGDGSASIGAVRSIRGGFFDDGFGGFVSRTPTPPVQPGGLVETRGRADRATAGPATAANPGPTPAGYPRVLVPGIPSGEAI